MYIIRLDDASEFMDTEKWMRIENILDQYAVTPIVGVIPDNHDLQLLVYPKDASFWQKVKNWQAKGWHIALHGYDHVCSSKHGGINPVHQRSEFAGVDLAIQKEKIRNGIKILKENDLEPKIFFAPSHTYDCNTLLALESESNIRVISDSIAYDTYLENSFYFIPQQAGYARKIPFITATFCYHPNNMTEQDFVNLKFFLNDNAKRFLSVTSNKLPLKNRKKNVIDKLLSTIYFGLRRVKN